MAKYYHEHPSPLRFCNPYLKTAALGCIFATLGLILKAYAASLTRTASEGGAWGNVYLSFQVIANRAASIMLMFSAFALALSVLLLFEADERKLKRLIEKALYNPSYGNPLHLKERDLLPHIICEHVGLGSYNIIISAHESATASDIEKCAPSISSALNRKLQGYAVTSVETDIAFNSVTFRVEDVKRDHTIIVKTSDEMRPSDKTLLFVDKENSIDLTTSGSILVVGKTRSGKTTGVIALLLQVLSCGRDNAYSEVIIIDPKQAELSRLPHTVTLDEDGEATSILSALKNYSQTITNRQRFLNNLSEEQGDAVKWWDAGLNPSFLFIDEYVACRAIFPKKATKDSDYCLDTFDNYLKRIVTMGASAGCFAIISIAEASVQEGGLPAMLRSAMSTKILFRPTKTEALLIWDKQMIETLPSRAYNPGEAWFSSTDGKHDVVSCVKFPSMEFPAYRELSRLLTAYYE